MVSLGIIAVLVSMLAGVVSAMAGKRLALYFGKVLPPLYTVGIGILPMALGVLIYGAGSLSLADILLSLGSGVFLAAGFILRYKVLSTEQVTNISVLGQSQTAIIVLVSLFVFNETLNAVGIASMIVIAIGAILVLGGEGFKINKRLLPTLFSSSFWGIYWVMIIAVVNQTGNFLFSLFLARVMGILVLIVFLWLKRDEVKIGAKALSTKGGMRFLGISITLAIVTGLFNGIGDTLFGVVSFFKIAAIGSAISSATGLVVIAILSYFIFRERLDRMEMLGFAVMLIGTFVLSVYG